MATKKEPETDAPAEGQPLAPAAPTPPEESHEQRMARKAKENYLRRNEESMATRREILANNNLIDNAPAIDPNEAYRRCCT